MAGAPAKQATRMRQAIKKTTDNVIISKIEQNRNDSFLLKTPPEVFNRIMRYTLGDRLIHVKHVSPHSSNVGALQAAVCTANESERGAYRAVVDKSFTLPAGEDPDFYVPSCKNRHSDCIMVRDGPAYMPLKLDLAFLGTSRHVYEGAHFIFWSTNTFSFDDGQSLRKFFDILNTTQRKTLGHIHISMNVAINEPSMAYISKNETTLWKRAITAAIVQKLKGLRCLNLCIEQHHVGVHGRAEDGESEEMVLEQLEPLSHFQALPLTEVTVIVNDNITPEEAVGANRWTISRKLALASCIKDKIANPLGDKVAKAEKDAKRQELERQKAEQQQRFVLECAQMAEKAQTRVEQATKEIARLRSALGDRERSLAMAGIGKGDATTTTWELRGLLLRAGQQGLLDPQQKANMAKKISEIDEFRAMLPQAEAAPSRLQKEADVDRKVAEIVASDPTMKYSEAAERAEREVEAESKILAQAKGEELGRL